MCEWQVVKGNIIVNIKSIMMKAYSYDCIKLEKVTRQEAEELLKENFAIDYKLQFFVD